MDNSTVPLAAIGLVATILAVVVTPLFTLLKNATKAQEANTHALEKMALSTDKVAAATVIGNDEAKQRNGHLGEQNVQITELIMGQNKDISSIKTATEITASTNMKVAQILSKSALIAAEDRDILTGGNQVVHEQTVEHQTVNNSVNET